MVAFIRSSVFSSGLAVVALTVLNACGGSGGGGGSVGPGPVSTPTPSTNVTPTPTPTPAGTPAPGAGATSCALGYGTVGADCTRSSSQFLSDVMGAIDKLQQEQPALFNTSQTTGEGQWRVLDAQAYYAGVIANLRALGHCSDFDGAEVQVKNTNAFSEQFDILLGSGHVRRGDAAYRATCNPANFPLDPTQVIARVRVGFYSIACTDGNPPPRNGEDVLRIGCTGQLTATPKDKNEDDVPESVHGPTADWRLEQEGFIVDMDDVPNSPFNKVVSGHNLGHFTICASVKGIEGCLHGEVVR